MSVIAQQLGKTGNMLRALEAATNWRALIMLLSTLLAFIFLVSIGAATNSKTFIGIMVLIGAIGTVVGLSATGHMLMDQARGVLVRGHIEALLAAAFSVFRLAGAALLILLTFALTLLIIALLLLPSKIPGLGPVLYTFVFPISSAFAGIAIIALFVVGPTILLPAIWEGHGVIPAMARLWAIVRNNLLLVVLSLVLLALLVGVIGGVVFSLVLAGSLTTSALAVPIIGYEATGGLMGIFTNLTALMGGFGESGRGFVIANMIGWLVLNSIATSITLLIWLSGTCHIYLQSAEGLDFETVESRINQGMDEAKRRAREAQARAQHAAEQARTANMAATSSVQGRAVSTAASTPTCPECKSPVTVEDVFCGNCGHRLQD